MSVRQLKNGKFVMDYYPHGRHGKRVQKVLPEWVKTEDQARMMEQAHAAVDKGERPADKPLSTYTTVDDLFSDYLDWYKDYRAKTTHRDLSAIYHAHFTRLLGSVRISELGVQHINLYKRTRAGELSIRGFKAGGKGKTKERTGETVGNRTIMKELVYFSGFLKWARREKGLELAPIHIEKLPYARPKPIVLSPEEIRKILDAAGPVHKAFILCLYSLGLRLAEARNLKWTDVDFGNGALRVTQKGGEMKILPMNEWLKKALKALERNGEYVFPSKDKEKPLGDIRKALGRICEAAGIEKKVSHHLFRHSIATHLMGNDVSTRVIQKYLGHAQLQTSEWYTHVAMGHLAKASSETLSGVLTTRTRKKRKITTPKRPERPENTDGK